MPPSEIPTAEQVRQLQQLASDASTRRIQAEASRDAAAAQLAQILADNGVATIEELAARSAEADQAAVAAYGAAQQALGLT